MFPPLFAVDAESEDCGTVSSKRRRPTDHGRFSSEQGNDFSSDGRIPESNSRRESWVSRSTVFLLPVGREGLLFHRNMVEMFSLNASPADWLAGGLAGWQTDRQGGYRNSSSAPMLASHHAMVPLRRPITMGERKSSKKIMEAPSARS